MIASDVRDLVEALTGEVENGGFEQYFSNNSGDHVEETLTALELLGADRTAEIVRRACARFPSGMPPRDAEQRRERLGEVFSRGLFDAEDGDFYQRGDDLETLVRAYEVAEDRAILGNDEYWDALA